MLALYRLAERYGRHDVEQFASELSPEQFAKLRAYANLEPPIGHRMDLLSAMMQHTSYLLSIKGKPKFSVADFLPNFAIYKDAAQFISPVTKQPMGLGRKIYSQCLSAMSARSAKGAKPPERKSTRERKPKES